MLGLAIYNVALFVGAKVFYLSINRYVVCRRLSLRFKALLTPYRNRDRQWNGMSKEEKEMYLSTTEDKGNKRLDFRFAH